MSEKGITQLLNEVIAGNATLKMEGSVRNTDSSSLSPTTISLLSAAIGAAVATSILVATTLSPLHVSVSNPPSLVMPSQLPVTLASPIPSGTNTIGSVNVLSAPLPSGAATATNQVTANASLSSISNSLVGVSTASNQATANASLASIGAALTGTLSVSPVQILNSWIASGYYNSSSPIQVSVMGSSYTYTGSNVTGYIQSSSSSDSISGTGCQKLSITYFKADGSGPFTDTVNMQGTTGFYSPSTVAFIQSLACSQVGSSKVNLGTILFSNLSPLSTMASINANESETQYAHHFVPVGKTAYITDFSFGSTSTTAARSGVFSLKKMSIPLSSNAALNLTGTMRFHGTSDTDKLEFKSPIKVVGPAVIFTQVTPDASTADSWFSFIGGYEQ